MSSGTQASILNSVRIAFQAQISGTVSPYANHCFSLLLPVWRFSQYLPFAILLRKGIYCVSFTQFVAAEDYMNEIHISGRE